MINIKTRNITKLLKIQHWILRFYKVWSYWILLIGVKGIYFFIRVHNNDGAIFTVCPYTSLLIENDLRECRNVSFPCALLVFPFYSYFCIILKSVLSLFKESIFDLWILEFILLSVILIHLIPHFSNSRSVQFLHS